MQRYNSFNLIHKGLRAALYQTSLQLQLTDFTATEETEEALNRVREIVMLFDGHAHKEDSFILPAIEAYEPSVVAAFQSEHEEDERLGKQLNACVEKLESASTLLEKIVGGRELTEAFAAFTAFNLQHMAKEEDIINKILWRYYTDDEIRAIGTKISQSVQPWMQEFYAAWMLRGINDSEAVTWMKAIEKGMPPVVFQSLLQKAEEVWPDQRYRKVTALLTEGAQLA